MLLRQLSQSQVSMLGRGGIPLSSGIYWEMCMGFSFFLLGFSFKGKCFLLPNQSVMTKNSCINIASWNINCLNRPVKRAAGLDYLCRHQVDVAFIQESHLKQSDAHRFANKYYHSAASAFVD